MTDEFHYDLAPDGVATITWDIGPERSMNVLTMDGIDQLERLIDQAIADDAVKGVVLASGKPDFAGGMDLNVLATIRARAEAAGDDAPERLLDFILNMHRVLRKIETMGADAKAGRKGKPVAAAAPGSALGIGYEIMLAANRRFAADAPAAKIGLPEIKLGMFPGAGGTTRLLRMLGLMGAAPFLLQGKLSSPKEAKAAGLIDAVVEPSALLEEARAWVRGASADDALQPWDKKGFKFPGGGPYHPAGFQMWLGAVAMAHGESRGAYPAVKAMLSAAYEGALLGIDDAVRVEARWFTRVMLDPSSSAMIRTLFQSKQALEKGARRPADVAPTPTRRLGVLGAGMMGAGVAHIAASAGIDVVLLDRDEAGLSRGREAIADLLGQGVKRGKVSEADAAAARERVLATTSFDRLAGCDLVVEAVFEDPGVKATVTQAAEAALGDDAVFATNTSTLPITQLAEASARPERFVGVHFFSPVHKMMLVEVIRGPKTGDDAVAKALDFTRQLKKTPIVVNDARFFYANRCILPYVNEGVRMVAEGVPPALVENVARNAGMPVGPLQLCDEVSLELGLRIADATRAALGGAYDGGPADGLLRTMVQDKGRIGRKSGAGFYDYDDRGRRTRLWPGLADLHPPAPPERRPSPEIVRARLLTIQALEAVRALEDGVLEDAREGDVAAILGWGFAPWSGGPLSYVDTLGAAVFAAEADALAANFGDRFAPPGLLGDLARSGATLYDRYAPTA